MLRLCAVRTKASSTSATELKTRRQTLQDTADLLRTGRNAGEKAKADAGLPLALPHTRSPQRGSGEGARGKAIRQASSLQGAMLGLGMTATGGLRPGGPGGAEMQYAVSGADAELFNGVPGLGAEPEAPGGPGTAGEAGTSELRQAADAQLPSSVPASPMET